MTPFEPPADARPDDEPWPAMEWPDPTAALINEHVRLSRTTEDDAEALFAALDEPIVWEHVSVPPADTAAMADLISAAESTGWCQWTVRDSTGAIAGTSSYLEVSAEDARLEIGWTLYAPCAWGTEVNPATKLLLLTHAFQDLAVGRVQLKTDVRNVRSQRAIARLGATYEGTLRRYQRRRDGSVRDTVLFSITAEEWPDVRARLQDRLL